MPYVARLGQHDEECDDDERERNPFLRPRLFAQHDDAGKDTDDGNRQ